MLIAYSFVVDDVVGWASRLAGMQWLGAGYGAGW
jgi:hypothetical protein